MPQRTAATHTRGSGSAGGTGVFVRQADRSGSSCDCGVRRRRQYHPSTCRHSDSGGRTTRASLVRCAEPDQPGDPLWHCAAMGAWWRVFLPPWWLKAGAVYVRCGTGSGLLAAINQDRSVSSSDHPAEAGRVVMLFGTGWGAMAPLPVDGSRPAHRR